MNKQHFLSSKLTVQTQSNKWVKYSHINGVIKSGHAYVTKCLLPEDFRLKDVNGDVYVADESPKLVEVWRGVKVLKFAVSKVKNNGNEPTHKVVFNGSQIISSKGGRVVVYG